MVPAESAGAVMESDAVAPPPIQTGTTDVVATVAIEYAIAAAAQEDA
jgi:hypothetical protein